MNRGPLDVSIVDAIPTLDIQWRSHTVTTAVSVLRAVEIIFFILENGSVIKKMNWLPHFTLGNGPCMSMATFSRAPEGRMKKRFHYFLSVWHLLVQERLSLSVAWRSFAVCGQWKFRRTVSYIRRSPGFPVHRK